MRFGYFSHVWGRPGVTPAERYRELWDEVALADRLGFDYAFSVEHHFSPDESWMPSPAIFCTGAALRTERIRIGPMGYLPALGDPIRIVEEVAALDQVLGGRLELGVASGIASTFFNPFKVNFDERKQRTQEFVDLLRTAFGTDEAFDFTGPFHDYSKLNLSFGPVQRPHPPLWVPTGDRRTLRWLATIGAHTSATMIVPRAALGTVYRHYVDWWRAAGHRERPNIGYWTLVHVGPSDEEAMSRAASHITHTLTKTLGYGHGQAPAPQGGSGELSTATIMSRAADVDFLLDHNLIFVGSPETVVRQITAAAKEGHFNTLLAELNIGLMSEAELTDSATLFATDVMPALRAFEPF
jgi:alkanesulfonate monooxygenase SsuD/methylene tetrahydromethanopterin reductase-like flavin-dependent oxidoreductase (luciferase family)